MTRAAHTMPVAHIPDGRAHRACPLDGPVTQNRERVEMFATIRRARAWRVAFLVATVSAVSALAASAVFSGPGAASASSSVATQTRSVSCNPYQFLPVDSA